jgi:uncharacterized membrane protein
VEKHRRSIAKAITWRATGSVDTFVLSWLLSGSMTIAGGIATTEVLTKSVLYYLHERAWTRVTWGRTARAPKRWAEPVAPAVSAPAPMDEVGAAEAA